MCLTVSGDTGGSSIMFHPPFLKMKKLYLKKQNMMSFAQLTLANFKKSRN